MQFVTAGGGRGDVQNAGMGTESSSVSSGESGEQRRPCGLPRDEADPSMCVSSSSRRACGCVSQVERLRSPSELCDQWCPYHHPLPCVLHLSTRGVAKSMGPPVLGHCVVLSCRWICFAVIGMNEMHNVFRVVEKPDHILARFEVSSVQCILSPSEQNSFYSWFTES